uniref:Uncharacterized protein n=1 Tax=Anguilla anguilla TaxID=7936 RepID=A0A0E9TWK1_ANGAN
MTNKQPYSRLQIG